MQGRSIIAPVERLSLWANVYDRMSTPKMVFVRLNRLKHIMSKK